MKVTVIKYLNVRVGKPSVNAPCYQYLAPGSEIEVDGKLYPGDKYDNIDTWLRDAAENYYWSGGIKMPDQEEDELSNTELGRLKDYLVNFPGDGNGKSIAVLDSGANDQHPKLNGLVTRDSYLEDKNMDDLHAHGHKVAGIISSNDAALSRNNSHLYCLRVSDSGNAVDSYAAYMALKDIADPNKNLLANIDVVNMSIELSKKAIPKVQPVIDSLMAAGIVVVVAAGEGLEMNRIGQLDHVIKVGVFDEKWLKNVSNYNFLNLYDTCYLNTYLASYSLDGSTLDDKIKDDSAYAAVVSAIIARHIQHQNIPKDGNRFSTIQTYIQSLNVSLDTNPEPLTNYKL